MVAPAVSTRAMSSLPTYQKSRLRRFSRAIGTRLVMATAVLFIAQDKILLRPGLGGDVPGVSVTRAGWSADWLEDGGFRGKVYSAAGEAQGTVMVFHGNAGTINDREKLAQQFTNRGLRVILAEYPGFGEREGWATVSAALAAGMDDFTHAQKRWSGPYYVAGESFGAGIAAQVASRNPTTIHGVLLFTPWDSLKNVVDEKFFGVPVGWLLRKHLDSKQALEAYPGNIGIVAAGADSLIPVSHAQELAKSLPRAVYRELPGAGHNTWPMELTRLDWDQLMAQMVGPLPAAH